MGIQNFFSSTDVDRVSDRRADDTWVADRLEHPTTRLVPVWRARSFVFEGDPPAAVLLEPGPLSTTLAELEERGVSPILLGLESGPDFSEDERAIFAVDVSSFEEHEVAERLGDSGVFVDLWRYGSLLSDRDGTVLAYARGMAHWHRESRHCGRCGTVTRVAQAGHLRVCTDEDCGKQVFPRTDPAVIMLVTADDRALLGRQPSWPPGMYSTLAGFCEPGESLENAVAREVLEETGIVVEEARYHSSQPWPFPQSLMLGFLATSPGGEPRVDGDELEDARWFTREELRQLHERREIRLPNRLSIARRLVEHWLEEEPHP